MIHQFLKQEAEGQGPDEGVLVGVRSVGHEKLVHLVLTCGQARLNERQVMKLFSRRR